MTKYTIEEFLLRAQKYPFVDVRSPAEYKRGHIPGAVSMPLFDDVERAEIGTLYKLKGKEQAVERGLQMVAPKLAEFVQGVKRFSIEKRILVYCWRGGMRSQSFAWLMNTAGLNAGVLDGGYKKFRNYVLNFFSQPLKLVRLGGETGSGKTSLLRKMAEQGEQVLDLEKIANHKGSAFGSINEMAQLPQQQFEHIVFRQLMLLNPEQIIWVEDEAMTIGWNKIPIQLWKQMKAAPLIKLNVPFEKRVSQLVADYSTTDKQLLRTPLIKIGSKLGGQHLKSALEFLELGRLDKVAEIALRYYDEAYHHDIKKHETKSIIEINCNQLSEGEIITQILCKAREV
jgi:tRNA 2-selenouridine synthase